MFQSTIKVGKSAARDGQNDQLIFLFLVKIVTKMHTQHVSHRHTSRPYPLPNILCILPAFRCLTSGLLRTD